VVRPLRKLDERGATAVIVALLIVVLFGFTALAVDVFRMYEEKRQVQRTADASALSGAQLLRTGTAEAEAEAKDYVKDNPTTYHLQDWYTGDDALAPSPCDPFDDANTYDCVVAYDSNTICDPNGAVPYDCVVSRVVAPPKSQDSAGFDFLFAKVLGFEDRPIPARAVAVLGAGAPGGEKMVPWMILDCPTPDYGETIAAWAIAVQGNPNCIWDVANGEYGYRFSDDWDNGPRTDLFLSVQGAQGGNFQGVDLSDEPCPPPATADGLFPKSGGAGGSDYREFLAGLASADVVPCNIARTARVFPKTGEMVGPTKQGLNDRGVDLNCMNKTAFEATFELGTIGDGEVSIIDPTNPCLVVLLRTVKVDPDNSAAKTDVPGNLAMQHPDPLNPDDGRFSVFKNGASEPLIVRDFSLFYLTELGNAQKPYRGLFLKTTDSGSSDLDDSPCEATTSICVVKLVQ
jgi:Putative Flp pilus-assembly TadE/G-like